MSDTFNHEADAWDSLLFHDEPHEELTFPKSCRYCGAGGLWWAARGRLWRLVDEAGVVHTCSKYVAASEPPK